MKLHKIPVSILIVLVLLGSVVFSFLEIPKFFAKLHLEKGLSLAAEGKYGQAQTEYVKAAGVNIPIKIYAYSDTALLFIDQGKYEEAITECNNAINLDQNNYYPYAIRAFSYSAIDHSDEALDDVNKCIELNASYGYAYAIRAAIRIKMKKTAADYLQILQDCNKAIQLNPSLSLAFKTRADVYLIAGQVNASELNNAIADYSQAIKLDPKNSASSYYGRGMAELKKGDKTSGLNDLNTFIGRSNDTELIKSAKQVIDQINSQ